MIYARQPSDEEGQELRLMIRRETGRVSQRARMIMLSAQRRTTTDLAEIFTTDKVTVRRWIHRYNVQGPVGLYDVPRPGRPRKYGQPEHEGHDGLPPPTPIGSIWSPAAAAALDGGHHDRIPDDATAQLDERREATGFTVRMSRRRRRPTRAPVHQKRHGTCS
jgi:Helix-turn-helix domain